jgi:hypothetical protein
MTEEIACEVFARNEWQGIDLQLALKMPNTREKRCPECHGRVRAHSVGSNGMKAHMEHFERHKGCSRGNYFDGTATLHPSALE